MTEAKTFAHLKPDTPFSAIFPDRQVPIVSLFPIIPREEGCPPCYVVDAQFLDDRQVAELAKILMANDPNTEGHPFDEIVAYVREGLPLRTEWFNGRGTSDRKMFAMLTDFAADEDY